MTSKTYSVSIEDLPGKRLLGNWMSLNVIEDKNEYAQVKEAFSRRLKGLPGFDTRPGYGVCSNIRENLDCRYWTVVEDLPGSPTPKGMVPINVDSGRYACLAAAKNVSLGEFYHYIRNFWETEQADYLVDRQKPCFEFLGQQWTGMAGMKLFVPLKDRYRQAGLEGRPSSLFSA